MEAAGLPGSVQVVSTHPFGMPLDAAALARKPSTKQLATAPVSSVSGDQSAPVPPNSAGGAITSGDSPGDARSDVTPSGRLLTDA